MPGGSRPACGCERPRPGRAPGPRQAAVPAWPDGSGTARGRRTRIRAAQVRSRPASLNQCMGSPINAAALAAVHDEVIDWRFKGLPSRWWGRSAAQICAERPELFDAGAVGPVCVLRAEALTHNLTAMASWCGERGVELAPHGKTHMAPELFARQLDAGACGITAATLSHVRTYRAFGVRDVVLANELVDAPGLRWLAAELDANPDFSFVCWVDSVRGVQLMTEALAGGERRVDVCVEVGIPGGRTGCRGSAAADEVAQAAAASPRLRLVGVAGYEAALGHDIATEALSA